FHAVSPFCCRLRLLLSFLFTDSPPSEIYTLSLHDALPILAALMADFQEQIGTVVFGQGMQFQLEHSSGSQVGQVALSPSYIRRQASVKTRNVIKNGETSLIEDNPDLSTVAQLDRLMLPSKPDIWP